jgi:hypothetical protein
LNFCADVKVEKHELKCRSRADHESCVVVYRFCEKEARDVGKGSPSLNPKSTTQVARV